MGLGYLERSLGKHTVRSADLISNLDKGSIKKFNFSNLTNWQQQLSDNVSGKIQTWAIFGIKQYL